MNRIATRAAFLLLFFFSVVVTPAAAQSPAKSRSKTEVRASEASTPDEVMLKGIKARSIGPAVMGGCVSAVALDPEDLFTFYIKEYTGESVKITVTNSAGRTVANLSAPGTPGISRVVWDLKPTKDLLNDYGGEGQKFMKSGDYTVSLAFGKTKETQKLHVEIAPGVETR